MGREFLFLVDTSPCPVLPAFVSQLCPPRDVVFKAVVAEIVLQRVETGVDPSATYPPDLTTFGVRSLVTKLYVMATCFLSDPSYFTVVMVIFLYNFVRAIWFC